jgi:hypothetical protein
MQRNYNLDMICKLAKRPCYFLLKPESLVSANLRAINEHLLEVQERARFTGNLLHPIATYSPSPRLVV